MPDETTSECIVRDATSSITKQITRMDIDQTMEHTMEIYWRVQTLKAVTKEIDVALKEAMVSWINANGDIEVGDTRYYVGASKTTKCTDKSATLEAILTATGGDLDAVLQAMTSQPFKHGACKQMLGAAYGKVFETIVKEDVKTGKPVKGLQVVDQNFLKKGQKK